MRLEIVFVYTSKQEDTIKHKAKVIQNNRYYSEFDNDDTLGMDTYDLDALTAINV